VPLVIALDELGWTRTFLLTGLASVGYAVLLLRPEVAAPYRDAGAAADARAVHRPVAQVRAAWARRETRLGYWTHPSTMAPGGASVPVPATGGRLARPGRRCRGRRPRGPPPGGPGARGLGTPRDPPGLLDPPVHDGPGCGDLPGLGLPLPHRWAGLLRTPRRLPALALRRRQPRRELRRRATRRPPSAVAYADGAVHRDRLRAGDRRPRAVAGRPATGGGGDDRVRRARHRRPGLPGGLPH